MRGFVSSHTAIFHHTTGGLRSRYQQRLWYGLATSVYKLSLVVEPKAGNQGKRGVPMIGHDVDGTAPWWVQFLHLIWNLMLWGAIGGIAYFSGAFAGEIVCGPKLDYWCSGGHPPDTEAAIQGEAIIGGAFVLLFGYLWVAKPLRNAWQFFVFRQGMGGGSGGIAGLKRLKGFFIGIPIWVVFLWGPVFLVAGGVAELTQDYWVVGEERTKFRVIGEPDPQPDLDQHYTIYFYLFMASSVAPVLLYFVWLRDAARERIGRLTSPIRGWWRRRGFGSGGSARFAGMLEEWTVRYKKGSVLLGSSMYSGSGRDSAFKIGVKDDRHMLTIAGSRGGKGRSAIIPNLIVWPHSALVIDPKGTNAAVTAARRGKGGGRVRFSLGQDVYLVDPFEIVKDIERACFNPLTAIDLDAITVTEDISNLADALIVPEAGAKSAYWTDGAKTIVSGAIAHALVVARTEGKQEIPTLLDIRAMLTGSAKEMDAVFGAMQKNTEAAGLARVAANLVQTAGANERGSLMNTVSSNMKWLDSIAMKKIMGRSDFDLADLKNGKTTVYVVLPPNMLEEHKRFMRLFVNLAIREMSTGERSKNPVLFVLDEFFALGTLSLLEKAAGLLGGYNMKLWPIVQNLGQLEELYPKNWETFFANAAATQVFAVNDLKTEEYLVRMLGKTVQEIEIDQRLTRVVNSLLETEDMEVAVARESKVQIVFRSGATPLLIRRMNYDTSFHKFQYAHDPDVPLRWWEPK